MLLQGHVDEISRRRIAGWAVDMDNPIDPVTVLIVVNGREHRRLKAETYRPNLKEGLGGGATGHHAFRFDFEPPLSGFEEYRIEVKFGDHDRHVPNGSKVLPRPAQAALPLLPIILTSVGRSGSTLMMSELGRHSEIVIGDTYPFEIKLLAYYSQAFDVLVATQDRANSTDPLTMFAPQNRGKIGHNPYNAPGALSGSKKGKAFRIFSSSDPG
jgi:hypothetical protein